MPARSCETSKPRPTGARFYLGRNIGHAEVEDTQRAKKRFQVKKSGKVKHAKAFAKHLSPTPRTQEHDRRNRGTGHLRDMDAKKVIKELFPYGADGDEGVKSIMRVKRGFQSTSSP